MEGCESDEFDPTTSSLLAMAEAFMGQTPPRIADAVRCLLALLTQHPPPRIEAHARLELGLTLFHHTNNLLEAREHLDKAVLVAQSVSNLEEVCYQASSVSARILVEQQNAHQAKSLLRTRIDASTRLPYWHLRLLLQLADISMTERDEEGVVSTLNRCVEYARQIDAPFTRLLCSLYKGAFLLVHHRYQEAGEVLNQTSGLMESYHGHKELLIRTFYLVVQVSHLLVAGQIKAAKPHLKQLQQRVKALSSDQCVGQFSAVTSSDPRSQSENFQWLTKQETFSMVYLVSVMHSVQGGYMDKALSYSEKAVQFMSSKDTATDRGSAVVSILQAHLLEQIVQCLLMKGDVTEAAEKIEDVIGVCHGHPQLVYAHRAVLHTLLGLYAFAVDDLEKAALQLHAALQHTNNGELRTYVSLNLALTYLKMGESHQSELAALMKSLETDSVTDSCQSLRAALHYVRGLFAFTQLKVHDAKRHLRETLLLSNKGDLNRLTTCALILLGQIFLSIGNTQETTDMVNPAVQLASKIPDKNLQVWAVSLLADLHHLTGDRDKEVSVREESNAIAMEIRAEQGRAVQCKQHFLAQWTVGEWPVSRDHQLSSLNYGGGKQTHKHKKHHTDSSSTPSHLSAESTPTNERLSKKRRRSHDMHVPQEDRDMSPSSGRSLSGGDDGSNVPHSSLNSSLSGEMAKVNSSASQSPTLLHKTPELKLKKIATPPTSSPLQHPLEESNEVRSGNFHKERLHGEDHGGGRLNSRYISPHQTSRTGSKEDRTQTAGGRGDFGSSMARKRSYDQREQEERLLGASETVGDNVIVQETVIHSGVQPPQSSRHNVSQENTSSSNHPADWHSSPSPPTPPTANRDPVSLMSASSRTTSRDSHPPLHRPSSPALQSASNAFSSQPQNTYSTLSYPRLSSLSHSPSKPSPSSIPSSRSPVTSLPSTSPAVSSRAQAVSEAQSLVTHALSPPLVSPPPPAASPPLYSGRVSPYSDVLQKPRAPSQAMHDYNHQLQHQQQQHQQSPKPTWQPYQQQQEQHNKSQELHHKLQQKLEKQQQQEQHHKLSQQQVASPTSSVLSSGRVSQQTSVDHSSRHTPYADSTGLNQQHHHRASNLSPQISSNFSPQPPSNMSHQPSSKIANHPTPSISPHVPGGTFSPQSASSLSPQPSHSRLPGSNAASITSEASPLQMGFKSPPEMGRGLSADQLSQHSSAQHSPAQLANSQRQTVAQMQQQQPSRTSFPQLRPTTADFGSKSSSSLFDDTAGFSPDLFDKGMSYQSNNPLLHQQAQKDESQSILGQQQMRGTGIGLYSSSQPQVSTQSSDLLQHPNSITNSQHRLQQQQQQQRQQQQHQQQQLLQQQQLIAQQQLKQQQLLKEHQLQQQQQQLLKEQQQQQLLKEQQLQQQQQQLKQLQQQQQQQLLLQRQQQYMMQMGRQPSSTHLPQPSLNMPFHSTTSQPSMHGQLPGYYPGAGQTPSVPSPRKSIQMPQLMHMQPLHRIPGVHDSGMPSAPDLHLTGVPVRHTIPGAGTVPSAGGNAFGLSNFPGSLGTVQPPGMHQLPNGANFSGGSGLLGQPGSQLGHFYQPQ